jgi:hypothetical protein
MAPDGELRIRFNATPLTRDAWKLGDLQTDARHVIEATSPGGMTLHCDNLFLTSAQRRIRERSSSITYQFHYSRAQFKRPAAEPHERPAVRQRLRGFETMPACQANCPLGDIQMAGKYPISGDEEKMTGELLITAREKPSDLTAWQEEVDRLFRHVIDLMSFALSRQVGSPIKEVWSGTQWECFAYNQTNPRRSAQQVLHPMRLQPFFDAAVASFFNPPIEATNLAYALEWFTLPTTYSEVRLTGAMTALENLIDSNLSDVEQHFLKPEVFKKLGKELRGAIAGVLDQSPEVDAKIAAEMTAALPAKMLDLNRRSFSKRFKLLTNRWGVPLDDLPMEKFGAAVTARNSIVHRGFYYDPGAASDGPRDLWDHVLLMREIIARFVFTVIGFKGIYLSFRGGQHDVTFPPVAPPASKEHADPDETAGE